MRQAINIVALTLSIPITCADGWLEGIAPWVPVSMRAIGEKATARPPWWPQAPDANLASLVHRIAAANASCSRTLESYQSEVAELRAALAAKTQATQLSVSTPLLLILLFAAIVVLRRTRANRAPTTASVQAEVMLRSVTRTEADAFRHWSTASRRLRTQHRDMNLFAARHRLSALHQALETWQLAWATSAPSGRRSSRGSEPDWLREASELFSPGGSATEPTPPVAAAVAAIEAAAATTDGARTPNATGPLATSFRSMSRVITRASMVAATISRQSPQADALSSATMEVSSAPLEEALAATMEGSSAPLEEALVAAEAAATAAIRQVADAACQASLSPSDKAAAFALASSFAAASAARSSAFAAAAAAAGSTAGSTAADDSLTKTPGSPRLSALCAHTNGTPHALVADHTPQAQAREAQLRWEVLEAQNIMLLEQTQRAEAAESESAALRLEVEQLTEQLQQAILARLTDHSAELGSIKKESAGMLERLAERLADKLSLTDRIAISDISKAHGIDDMGADAIVTGRPAHQSVFSFKTLLPRRGRMSFGGTERTGATPSTTPVGILSPAATGKATGRSPAVLAAMVLEGASPAGSPRLSSMDDAAGVAKVDAEAAAPLTEATAVDAAAPPTTTTATGFMEVLTRGSPLRGSRIALRRTPSMLAEAQPPFTPERAPSSPRNGSRNGSPRHSLPLDASPHHSPQPGRSTRRVFDEDEGAARAAADQVRKDAEERAAKAAARSPQCRAPETVTAEPEDTDASVIDMTLADAVVEAALIEAKAAVEQAKADANAQAAAAADDKIDDTLEPPADFVTPPACMQSGDVQVTTLNLEVPTGSEDGATRGILVAVDGIPVVPTTASALKPARKLLPCKLNVDGYVPGGQTTMSPTNASTNASPPCSMRLSVEHDVHLTPWGERSPLSASAADNAGSLPQYSQCSVPCSVPPQPPSRSPADKAPSPPPRSPRRDAMAWSPRQEGSSPQGSRVSFRDSDNTGSPLKACSSPLKAMHAAR